MESFDRPCRPADPLRPPSTSPQPQVLLTSHLGRPKGKEDKYSLAPVADRLSELLGKKVAFVEDCIGDTVANHVGKMANGDVALLENGACLRLDWDGVDLGVNAAACTRMNPSHPNPLTRSNLQPPPTNTSPLLQGGGEERPRVRQEARRQRRPLRQRRLRHGPPRPRLHGGCVALRPRSSFAVCACVCG